MVTTRTAAEPFARFRRLRRSPGLRALVRETRLSPDRFVYPLFVAHGHGLREEIAAMPGQFRLSVDLLAAEAAELRGLGIPAVLLFGLPAASAEGGSASGGKDDLGSEAYAADGIVPRAVVALKEAAPELVVVTDVCLCGYTSHGHCGIVSKKGWPVATPTSPATGHARIETEEVDNDATLELLARTALAHARAGADMVAPSDMMDGRVAAIRRALDAEGFGEVPIMAYAAKFASAFYGPFREAAESAPAFGDRRGYQMDPPNQREALREMEADLEEGADILMVKPALAYLDVLALARQRFGVPLAAYNVSGEYAMVKAAARLGWLEEEGAMLEVLTAIKRAGADIIVTYHAKEAARLLRG